MVPIWGRCTTHFSGDWHVHWGHINSMFALQHPEIQRQQHQTKHEQGQKMRIGARNLRVLQMAPFGSGKSKVRRLCIFPPHFRVINPRRSFLGTHRWPWDVGPSCREVLHRQGAQILGSCAHRALQGSRLELGVRTSAQPNRMGKKSKPNQAIEQLTFGSRAKRWICSPHCNYQTS